MNRVFVDSMLHGCGTVAVPSFTDARGTFVKPFHPSIFPDDIAPFAIKEAFVSQSTQGVLRGFHFQSPPFDQWKLVCCVAGEVLDVVLDLRRQSPTYLRAKGAVLRGPTPGRDVHAMLIPPGVAHAFYTLSEIAVLSYYVSCVYSPAHDRGVLWSSVPFAWPSNTPLISPRDSSFEALDDFVTPFEHSGIA